MFKNLNEKDKKKIYSLLTLAVICGIALIAMSGLEDKVVASKDEVNNKITQEELSNESSKATLEEKLKNILSQIEGAGEVDVMITYESSEEKLDESDAAKIFDLVAEQADVKYENIKLMNNNKN